MKECQKKLEFINNKGESLIRELTFDIKNKAIQDVFYIKNKNNTFYKQPIELDKKYFSAHRNIKKINEMKQKYYNGEFKGEEYSIFSFGNLKKNSKNKRADYKIVLEENSKIKKSDKPFIEIRFLVGGSNFVVLKADDYIQFINDGDKIKEKMLKNKEGLKNESISR